MPIASPVGRRVRGFLVVVLFVAVSSASQAQVIVTARETWVADPDAGINGLDLSPLPGQNKAVIQLQAGLGVGLGVMQLGGEDAGAVIPLQFTGGLNTSFPSDLLRVAEPSGVFFWGVSGGGITGSAPVLLHGTSWSSPYSTDSFIFTRGSDQYLRTVKFSASGSVDVSGQTWPLSGGPKPSRHVTIGRPATPAFPGPGSLFSPLGSDLVYEFAPGLDFVRLASFASDAGFGAPYALPSVLGLKLLRAQQATYLVTISSPGFAVIELGASAAIPQGTFTVALPASAPPCAGCELTTYELMQEGFPGYSSGALLLVYANLSLTSPAGPVFALVDWGDVVGALSLSIDPNQQPPALLDPGVSPDAGGGGDGGGGGGNGGGGSRPPPGPFVAGSANTGCSMTVGGSAGAAWIFLAL